MPLIQHLGGRDRPLCEFEASMVYRESSRTGSKATEKPCLEKKIEEKTKKMEDKSLKANS